VSLFFEEEGNCKSFLFSHECCLILFVVFFFSYPYSAFFLSLPLLLLRFAFSSYESSLQNWWFWTPSSSSCPLRSKTPSPPPPPPPLLILLSRSHSTPKTNCTSPSLIHSPSLLPYFPPFADAPTGVAFPPAHGILLLMQLVASLRRRHQPSFISRRPSLTLVMSGG